MRFDNHHVFCFGPEPPHVTITASGPWEALFIYCGTYDTRPDEVEVQPKIRGAGTYDCVLKDEIQEPFSFPKETQ